MKSFNIHDFTQYNLLLYVSWSLNYAFIYYVVKYLLELMKIICCESILKQAHLFYYSFLEKLLSDLIYL